jgi:hypothetical protein
VDGALGLALGFVPPAVALNHEVQLRGHWGEGVENARLELGDRARHVETVVDNDLDQLGEGVDLDAPADHVGCLSRREESADRIPLPRACLRRPDAPLDQEVYKGAPRLVALLGAAESLRNVLGHLGVCCRALQEAPDRRRCLQTWWVGVGLEPGDEQRSKTDARVLGRNGRVPAQR